MTEQQRFEDGLRRVLSVSKDEIQRRMAASKAAKQVAKADAQRVGKNLNRP